MQCTDYRWGVVQLLRGTEKGGGLWQWWWWTSMGKHCGEEVSHCSLQCQTPRPQGQQNSFQKISHPPPVFFSSLSLSSAKLQTTDRILIRSVCSWSRYQPWNPQPCKISKFSYGDEALLVVFFPISKTVVLQNLKCSYDDKALFLWIFFWSLQIPPTNCTRHFLFVWAQDGGATEYLSCTVFENCSTRLLRDFYMDNDFRAEWDKTLVQHRQLQVCHITGTEVGLMIKKFPMMIAREYVLAWRIWEGDEQSYYCVLKVFLIVLFVCVCDCVPLRLALYQDTSLILYSNFTQQILRSESARMWSVANGKLMTIGVCVGGRHVNTLMHHANPNISV